MSKATLQIICLALLTTIAAAQTPGYHLEFVEDILPPMQPGQRVILVNDSDKTIEASHLSAVCEAEGTRRMQSSMETTADTLDISSDRMAYPGLGGQTVSSNGMTAPKSQLILSVFLFQEPSGCTWNTKVDAVIYSDSTDEGDKEVA